MPKTKAKPKKPAPLYVDLSPFHRSILDAMAREDAERRHAPESVSHTVRELLLREWDRRHPEKVDHDPPM